MRFVARMPARLGVATVWDGVANSRFACSVLLWCASAERLTAAVSAPPLSPPIILGTTTASEDCPNARYLRPNATVAALMRYSYSRRSNGNLINLLKVHLFALDDLDYIMYADLDVDMAPPSPLTSKWLSWWHAGVDAFMSSAALVVGTPDHEAPLNTAALLIKPSRRMYKLAMDLFHANLTFDKVKGFNSIGTPRELINGSLHSRGGLDLSLLGVGLGAVGVRESSPMSPSAVLDEEVMKRMRKTAAYRRNTWTFAAGHIDQGFFFLLTLVLAPVATWSELNCRCKDRRWTVSHYWGPYKPWRRAGAERLTPATVRYLRNLPETNGSQYYRGSRCFAELADLRTLIQAKGMWTDRVAARGGMSISFQTLLPSTRVANFSWRRRAPSR